jgi:hypothetical protein
MRTLFKPRSISASLCRLNLNFTQTTRTLSPLITFSRASSATYFDSAGVLQTAGSGVARAHAFQDYNPSTLAPLGFLIEEQRTNLIRYSEQLDNAAWNTVAATISANAATAPTGTTIADKLIENSATATHYTETPDYVFVLSTVYTFTCFAKAGERSRIFFNFPTTFTNRIAVFDVSNGTVVSAGGMTCSIEAINNGWYRCRMTSTADLGGGGARVGAALVNTGTNTNYAGDGISGILLFGAQLEIGAFATSYISTTSAAATRLADSASITGGNFSGWYNQAEGTFVIVGDYSYIATGNYGLLRVDDNSGGEEERLMYRLASATQRFTVVDNNVEQCDISRSGVVAGTVFKHATAYKLNDFAACINGGTVGTDASGTIPTVDRVRFSGGLNSLYPNGHLQRLSYYRARLSDATLQSLST